MTGAPPELGRYLDVESGYSGLLNEESRREEGCRVGGGDRIRAARR